MDYCSACHPNFYSEKKIVYENDGVTEKYSYFKCHPNQCPQNLIRKENEDGTVSKECIEKPEEELFSIQKIKILTLTCNERV